MPGTAVTLVLASVFFFSFMSFAYGGDGCKKFQVSFSSPLNTSLDGVFHGGSQIGEVISPETQNGSSNMLQICIDADHSSEIEKNTVCYMSDKSLIVYNVWASGKDLPEHSTIPGFSSKISLFWYELKLLFNHIFG